MVERIVLSTNGAVKIVSTRKRRKFYLHTQKTKSKSVNDLTPEQANKSLKKSIKFKLCDHKFDTKFSSNT